MNIQEVHCDNCNVTPIYACVGSSECYVCKECHELLLAGEITLQSIEEKKAFNRQ